MTLDVVQDKLNGVIGETEDIANIGDDAGRFPGEQHLAIFGDLVLLFLGDGKIGGINVLEPDEHPPHTRPCAVSVLFRCRFNPSAVRQCFPSAARGLRAQWRDLLGLIGRGL